jgi:aspartate/glutamate racemase
MPVSQSATAPEGLDAPPRQFRHYKAAVRAIAEYQAALCENASRRRSGGLTVTDQDQPEEFFLLLPARPDRSPLAIIGGMGPLAGALAFRRACERFQDSRAVVLYQACSVPDRSTVILGEGCPDTPLCLQMALKLAGAVRSAVDLAPQANHPACCIIACNSAHYFWRAVVDALKQAAAPTCQVRMISLVESAIEALQFPSRGRALLLATEGAREGAIFSTPFRDAGIAFDEPSPALGRLLMSAIFEGVKALDERRAVELGNEFFEAILHSGRDYDCVLAGCTELPHTIDLLRLHGSPAVAAFLSRVNVVDPLEEALRRA